MTKRLLCIAAIVMIMAIASVPASAYYVNVVQSRLAGGAQNPLYTQNGPAASSANTAVTKLDGWDSGTITVTNWGSYYAGDSTPVKYGDWHFNPGAGMSGYYDVFATWSGVSAAQNMNPIYTVNNAGTAVNTAVNQTSGSGNGAWNLIASGVMLDSGTDYTTRLSTIGTGASGKRASFDSVAWATAAADAVSYVTANGIEIDLSQWNEFSWTAGAKTSFFNIYLGDTSGALNLVAGGLGIGCNALDMTDPTLGLQAGKTYYWRVDDGNLDRVTAGAEMMFTTKAVPEPSSMLAFATGLIGLVGIIRRKKA